MKPLLALLLAGALASAESIEVAIQTVKGEKFNAFLDDLPTLVLETSAGTLDIEVPEITRVNFEPGMVYVLMEDGSAVHGKMPKETWTFRTATESREIATSALASLTRINRPRKEKPRPPAVPVDLVAPESFPEGWRPTASIKATASFTLRPILDFKGERLLALQLPKGVVVVLDASDLHVISEIPVGADMARFDLTPDGKTLWAIGGKKVVVADVDTATVRKSFELEKTLHDVLALTDDVALVGGAGVVSASRQSAFQPGQAQVTSFLRCRATGELLTTWGHWPLPTFVDNPATLSLPYPPLDGDSRWSGGWVGSDARTIVSDAGDVARVGRTELAARALMGTVAVPRAAVVLKDRVLVFTDGFLKDYALPSVELRVSLKWPLSVSAAIAGPGDGWMILHGAPKPPFDQQSGVRKTQDGNWYRVPIPK